MTSRCQQKGVVGDRGVVRVWAWVCGGSPDDSARQCGLERGQKPPAGDHCQDLPGEALTAQSASVCAHRETQRLHVVTGD